MILSRIYRKRYANSDFQGLQLHLCDALDFTTQDVIESCNDWSATELYVIPILFKEVRKLYCSSSVQSKGLHV